MLSSDSDEDEFVSADEDDFDDEDDIEEKEGDKVNSKEKNDIGIQINEDANNTNESLSKIALPPAPPPTPALSSSYSNSEDPPASQFGWRIKSKQSQQKIQQQQLQQAKTLERKLEEACLEPVTSDGCLKFKVSPVTIPKISPVINEEKSKREVVDYVVDRIRKNEHKIEKKDQKVQQQEVMKVEQQLEVDRVKTRKEEPLQSSNAIKPPNKITERKLQATSVLDRLSESVDQSQKNQNIFDMVVGDIKRVSIRDQDGTSVSPPIPISITDLGSTLGDWGWSGASKLIASASQVTNQVTSQVGSVLDSVVNVAQQTIQQPQHSHTQDSTGKENESSYNRKKDKDV